MPVFDSSNPRNIPSFSVVVTAAGLGRRMGAGRKKPYLLLGGKSILSHTISVLRSSNGCSEIVVVVHPAEYSGRNTGEVSCLQDDSIDRLVPGGQTRQESALAGLEATRADIPLVLIHDGVRPLVKVETVEAVAVAAASTGAAISAIPCKETVKVADDEWLVMETPKRHDLWLAQTPQGFRRDLLLKAHYSARDVGFEGTDDSQLVERLDERVQLIMGDATNIKITTPGDIVIAEALLHSRKQMEGEPV